MNNSLASTRRYLKEQPREFEAIVKTIVEGNAFILNPANRARVTEILARNLRLTSKEAEKAYEDLFAQGRAETLSQYGSRKSNGPNYGLEKSKNRATQTGTPRRCIHSAEIGTVRLYAMKQRQKAEGR